MSETNAATPAKTNEQTPAATSTAPVEPKGNPFQINKFSNIGEGAVSVEEARAIAEVQGKMVIAQRFPRNEGTAYDNCIKNCKRSTFAETALYSYPKGNNNIVEGPSIRMAEMLAQNYGNMDFGIKELSRKEGVSEMQVYCVDLQTNVWSTQVFTVKHIKETRDGSYALKSERDIYELTANQGGRRLRARILALIPPDFVEACVAQVKHTLAGEASTLKERIKKMITRYNNYGVTKDAIEKKISKKVEEITQEDIVSLLAIFNSISDGARPSEFFDVKSSDPQPGNNTAATGSAALNSKINAKKEGKETKAGKTDTPPPAPEIPPVPPVEPPKNNEEKEKGGNEDLGV